jgi:hypothetical protein
MGSNRPAVRGRLSLLPPVVASALVLAALAAACAPRPPRLVPPASGVVAVEGVGSASVAGAEASVKGRFAFAFRRPDLGRIEAFDPLGRTAFLILLRDGRGWFILPGRKVYAEDAAAVMMGRVLGVALEPGDAVLLLSGVWPRDEATGTGGDAWLPERDAEGRLASGRRGEYAFAIRAFFPGDGVPREIGLAGPGTTGKVKIAKLVFDPPERPAAFDPGFLRGYAALSWAEILELVGR